jgi:hypothetical protein
MLATIDQAADSDELAKFEFLHLGTDRGDAADDLMTGDARVLCAGPL